MVSVVPVLTVPVMVTVMISPCARSHVPSLVTLLPATETPTVLPVLLTAEAVTFSSASGTLSRNVAPETASWPSLTTSTV